MIIIIIIGIKIIQRTFNILVDCFHSIRGRKRSGENTDSDKKSENGTLYEQLVLVQLAKKAHGLSKDGSRFKNFAIGREVNIGHRKLDDIVFRYEDNDNQEKPEDGTTPTRNLIFGQIKHKKDSSLKINYDHLTKAKMSGNMGKQFNLLQYFISFRTIREELKKKEQLSEELKNGKIKYIAIFTNVDIDKEHLEDKGCSLKEAPADIKDLFTQETNHFHQFGNVSDDLKNIFKKSSDLHIIAREFAQFVLSNQDEQTKDEKQKEYIMGSHKAMYHYIIRRYHVALGKEVIRKTEMENEKYYVAKFKEDFIDNEEPGSKKELRDAIFEAIRELGELKKDLNEDLKDILRNAEWKVHSSFGGNRNKNLPYKWMEVDDKDIDEFLECLVFSVNQLNVIDLLNQISSEKEKNFYLQDTLVGKALDDMDENFKDRSLKSLGIPRRIENWITGKEIEQFVKEQQEALICFIYTLLYEDKTMHYGKFEIIEIIEVILDSFLNYEKNKKITKTYHSQLKKAKILCFHTTMTLLTTVKILQYLNGGEKKAENCQISIKLEDLNSETFADRVEKAFKSENHNLLTIECTYDFKEKPERIVNLYYRFSDIIKNKDNPNKKIILIIAKNNLNTLTEKIRNYLNKFQEKHKQISDPCKLCVHETDEIIVKDFKPKEDPFTKKIIVFQGQKEEISLATLTGIPNWESYVADSSPNGIKNEEGIIIDAMTLVEILKNGEIIVGSRPQGTDSLECAYASLPVEIKDINKKNLVQKLKQQGPDSNVIYIVSGKLGSNGNEKMENLIQYLGLVNEQEEIKSYLGDIDSDSKIQITDDQFEMESFKSICHEHSDKQIFWIYTERENTFKFQKLFNPNFYLKRKYSIDNEQNEKSFIEEDELINEIKDRKIVIISGDPGMGKYTTTTKLYESKYLSESFLETHWIIRINLRERMSAIKNVKLDKGIIDIVNFLSKFDSELDNDVTKSLLEFALSKRKTTKKPLILVFDGFGEILDEDDRNKIISLLEFLEEKTAAKVWITTLPLYKEALENKLITFAIEFYPMNYELYIKQFFKDRLQLILNKEKFDEIFDESQENSNIEKYIKAFLNKIRSVFTGDIPRFVGTPLHLYLMLNGSVNSFKCWVENDPGQDPNFDYLGGDIREVHETFINKKFDIYCQKIGSGGRKQSRFIFDNCNESLARCLIFISDRKSEMFLETFKGKTSLAGIIKYYGSKVCFIVSSFGDFYSAKIFIDWIKRVEHDKVPEGGEKKYILEKTLRNPNFKLIRSFLNLELGICFNLEGDEKIMFEKGVEQCGRKAKNLFENERNSLIDENETVLHIAVKEGNRNIVRFLLDSLKEYKNVLREFLLAPDEGNVTALHLATRGQDDEIFNLLFDAENSVGMSGERKQEVFGLYEKNRLNALFTEIVRDISGIL